MTFRTKISGALGAIALVLGAFAVSAVLTPDTSTQFAASTPFGAANAQTAAADIDTSSVFEVPLGDEAAPITMIEYASFTCPHCANFHNGPLQDIKKDYIETGKVRLIHREVYFDRYALWTAMVARCVGPERYHPMIDLVYKSQDDLYKSTDPDTVIDNLRRLGRTAGLTDEAMESCMQDGEMAQAMVARYQQTADADGITATPSFVINGETYSNMSLAEFRKVLDGLLED